MRKWYLWLKRHRTAALWGLGVAAGLCLLGVSLVKFTENVTVMIPASVREKVELFQASSLNSKTFVVVKAPSSSLALRSARTLRENLEKEGLILPLPFKGTDFIVSLARALPYRFTQRDEDEAVKFITPQVVSAKMKQNFQELTSFQGAFVKDILAVDPLGLFVLNAEKLRGFDVTSSLSYADGFLVSKDGKTVTGVYEAAFSPNNFSAVKRFRQAFKKAGAELASSVQAFYLGAARYTEENASVIQRDLKIIAFFALAGMAALFGIFFRRKRALWIFALPFLILAPSALVTYWIFGEISGITLGFGSVVAGLAVDYAIYMYFALSSGGKPVFKTVQKMYPHLVYSYATSAVCFGAMLFSSIALFRQMAVFSIVGLTLALLLAVFFFPVFWKKLPPPPVLFFGWKIPQLSKTAAAVLLCVLLWCGAIGALRLQISGNLEELNFTSAAFKADKAEFDQLFSKKASSAGLLFVFGSNQEEALQNNEELARRMETIFPVSLVFPSQKAQEENLARWRSFWGKHGTQTRELIRQNALHWGLKPGFFKPFEYLTSLVQDPDVFDFSVFYNPLVSVGEGVAVVNMMSHPEEAFQENMADIKTVYVSAAAIKQDLASGIFKEAVKILIAALLLASGLVFYFLRNRRDVLFTFVPVAGAFSLTFFVFWLAGVKVNLFVLAFLPLLTGLGVDYGIFQVIRHRSGGSKLYPQAALLAAALSTLAGFGVLVLAEHPVLFIIGLSSCLGIAGAALSALFLLPPLLEDE